MLNVGAAEGRREDELLPLAARQVPHCFDEADQQAFLLRLEQHAIKHCSRLLAPPSGSAIVCEPRDDRSLLESPGCVTLTAQPGPPPRPAPGGARSSTSLVWTPTSGPRPRSASRPSSSERPRCSPTGRSVKLGSPARTRPVRSMTTGQVTSRSCGCSPTRSPL